MRRTSLAKLSLAALAPLFAASTASAATLYSETDTASLTPTNAAFIPNTTTTPGITTRILDNVIMPSVIQGAGGVNITRITMQVDQKGISPGGTVGIYYSTVNGNGNVAPTINAPQFAGNATPLLLPTTTGDTFTTVTLGDGSTTLFTLTDSDLNFQDVGQAEFALGYQLGTNGDPSQGIRLAMADTGFTQTPEYFEYDSATNTQNKWTFFAQNTANDGAGLWMTVEGTLVPEPTTLGLAAMGGLMLLARRPNKKEIA